MAFDEDLDAFFNTDDFALEATYKAGGTGAGTTIQVIFDAPGQEAFGISGTRPRALVKASDIASFSNTDTLTIGATTWRCVDSQPQDDGALLSIQLEKQ